MKNLINKATLPLGLLLIAYGIHNYQQQKSKPHHIIKKYGTIVISDYWTTNPIEKTLDWVPGVGTNSIGGMVSVTKTNRLW